MDSLVAFHTVKAHKDMHTTHASACKRNVLRDQMFGYVTYRYRSIELMYINIPFVYTTWSVLHGKKSTWPLWPVTTKCEHTTLFTSSSKELRMAEPRHKYCGTQSPHTFAVAWAVPQQELLRVR